MCVRLCFLMLGFILSAAGLAQAQAPATPPAQSVANIQDSHDHALIRDLLTYVDINPKASDLDQAYLKVFDKAIEHDWFADHEAVAQKYLTTYPEGPVRSLARIVTTMARAQAGQFREALLSYDALMAGLGGLEQEEFAATFAESLAEAAISAGEIDVARKVYEALIEKFGSDSPNLVQKIRAEISRLDMVGSPAPTVAAIDLNGATVRLADLKGKYVLVDFWATWCAPCTADLPRLQAAYAKYHPKGFEVVAVSLDESKKVVDEFVKARNLPWKQIHNATATGDLVEAFGVQTIPATFLIDPAGKIIRLELQGAALDKALETLIR